LINWDNRFWHESLRVEFIFFYYVRSTIRKNENFKNSCFHHHTRETHVQYWVIIENYFVYVIIIFKKLIVWCYVVYIFANDFWTFYIRRWRWRVCVFRMRRIRDLYNKSLKYFFRVIDAFLFSRTDEKNNFSRFRKNSQKHDNRRQQNITLLQNSICLEILYTQNWFSSENLNQIDVKSSYFFLFSTWVHFFLNLERRVINNTRFRFK
jgi:hypothetical protein